MRATQDLRQVDGSIVVAQFVLASIVGLILAPGLLADPARAASSGSDNLVALSWLVIGVLIGVWLVALAPSCVRLVADPVAAVRQRFHSTVPTTALDEAHNFARWVVAFGEILVIQAVLRPPLVVMLSGALAKANAEALVVALTLAVLLLVLVWVHQSARPLVVTAARSTLDVFLASTDSEATVLATALPATTTHRRSILTAEAATQPAPELEATRAAQPEAPTVLDATDVIDAPTMLDMRADKTMFAPGNQLSADADVTLHGGTETRGGGR